IRGDSPDTIDPTAQPTDAAAYGHCIQIQSLRCGSIATKQLVDRNHVLRQWQTRRGGSLAMILKPVLQDHRRWTSVRWTGHSAHLASVYLLARCRMNVECSMAPTLSFLPRR
ncbi:hypothetical protein WG66_004134, partial [Moniliophthora roreri]